MKDLILVPLSEFAQGESAQVPKCSPPLEAGDVVTIQGLGMQKNGKLTTRKNAHIKQAVLVVKGKL